MCSCKLFSRLSQLLLFILVLFQFNILAQEKGLVKYLTMEEAISRALKDNNIIKANKYAVKKANWDVKRAWAELFPQSVLTQDIIGLISKHLQKEILDSTCLRN